MVKYISLIIFVLALFSSPGLANAQGTKNNCIECHSTLSDSLGEPAHTFKNDIHLAEGILCQDCHGGNASAITNGDMSKVKGPGTGYIGRPAHGTIPKLCSRCHSNAEYMHKFNPNIRIDQYANYLTSIHGKQLQKGDKKVAVCTSCHHVHQMRQANDPQSSIYPSNIAATCGHCHSSKEYMSEYKIPVNQESNYRKSVHAEYLYEHGDLSAPTCNDCHGNHGATPPGVKSVIFVCGVCHPSQETNFSTSTHKEYFDNLGEPGCITCHGNHGIIKPDEKMIQVRDKELFCGKCHSEGDEQEPLILQIRGTIDSLKAAFQTSDSIVQRAAKAGMEIGEAQYQLSTVQTGITQSRNFVHSFSVKKILETAEPYFSSAFEIKKKGQDAMKEAGTRRTGLLISLVFIVFLIFVLVLKARQQNRRAYNQSIR